MARMPQLKLVAKEHGMKIITIKDLIAYRLKQESLVEKGVEADLPTEYGHFHIIPFRQKSNGLEHIAIFKGEWSAEERAKMDERLKFFCDAILSYISVGLERTMNAFNKK